MARRYDSRTTIFSPEGRLYQVEYALEAISHAGTCLGIVATDGIILAGEKKTTSKLLEQISHEKLYLLNDNMACAVAGLTSDANTLISYLRLQAQQFLFTYGEDMPCEQIVERLCNLKQSYTQFGGLRPFGVAFLYAGWDKNFGYQLYHSDPSGNYAGWKAHCIGSNSGNAQSILKSDYREDMTLKEAKSLAVKILLKTMDATTLSSDKLEFGTLSFDAQGVLKFKLLSNQEIDAMLKEENVLTPPAATTTTTTTTTTTA